MKRGLPAVNSKSPKILKAVIRIVVKPATVALLSVSHLPKPATAPTGMPLFAPLNQHPLLLFASILVAPPSDLDLFCRRRTHHERPEVAIIAALLLVA
nr:hypothetical protein CFP56_37519 [Quercus suber]